MYLVVRGADRITNKVGRWRSLGAIDPSAVAEMGESGLKRHAEQSFNERFADVNTYFFSFELRLEKQPKSEEPMQFGDYGNGWTRSKLAFAG